MWLLFECSEKIGAFEEEFHVQVLFRLFGVNILRACCHDEGLTSRFAYRLMAPLLEHREVLTPFVANLLTVVPHSLSHLL